MALCWQARSCFVFLLYLAASVHGQIISSPEWLNEGPYNAFVGEEANVEVTFDPHCPLAAPLTALSVTVLEDPGLPGGMQFSTTKKIYPVQDTAVLTWTPIKSQLLSNGPNGLEVSERKNYTVVVSADYLCGKVLTGIVETEVMVSIRTSQVEFVAPANNSHFVARVGCSSSFEISGTELSHIYDGTMHYGLYLDQDNKYVLPPGAAIVVKRDGSTAGSTCGNGVDVGHCPTTVFGIDWKPQRGQEGFDYTFCLVLRDEFHLSSKRRCFKVTVLRCEVCVQSGDTFRSLATAYDTDWMQLWGANHWVTKNPNVLVAGQPLYLGPVYTVRPHDSLEELAKRFSLPSKEAILAVNPDLNAAYYEDTLHNTTHHLNLYPGQKLCIIPPICSTENGSPKQVALGREDFGSSLSQKIVGRDFQWIDRIEYSAFVVVLFVLQSICRLLTVSDRQHGQSRHIGAPLSQGNDPNRANNVREDPNDAPL